MKSIKSNIILVQKFKKEKSWVKILVNTLINFDKILIVLSATCGEISISSFVNIIGAPVGIASASFSLIFFDYRNNNKNIGK